MAVNRTTLVLIAALIGQIAVAGILRPMRTGLEVLPPAPTSSELGLSAFGDRQFLYRQLTMALQNFGDTGGRITPLKNYDMTRVVEWLDALDTLDLAAQHHVFLAARYFGQTQDSAQIAHLVRFIQEHVARNPRASVQWLTEAIYLASRLNDRTVMIQIADQLGSYDFPEMTVVAYQLPAILHEQAGQYGKAAAYMERALRLTANEAPEQEKAFMRVYISDMEKRAKVE